MAKKSDVPDSLKKQMVDKLAALSTAGFALAAALAWNEAIQNWLKNSALFSRGGPWVYAVALTLLGVIVTVLIARAANRIER